MHVGIILLRVPPRARPKRDLCARISYTHVELYQFYFPVGEDAKFSRYHGTGQREFDMTGEQTKRNHIYFFTVQREKSVQIKNLPIASSLYF